VDEDVVAVGWVTPTLLLTPPSYFLHIGASTLPRTGGPSLTLAEAMRRAYGHRYAVVYRVLGDKPVPIIADAGSDEIVFVPTARRLHRDSVAWWLVVSDMELWRAMMPPVPHQTGARRMAHR
jgi:hypothetical protein